MAVSQTRFGAIPLRILRLGNGSAIVRGFSRESHAAQEHVPGSDRTITFLMGKGPFDATWQIESPSIDDYRDLEAAVQTEATLVVPHGTQNAPAVTQNEFGDLYDHIAGVVLMSLTNEVIHNDGTVRADAWFRVPS